MFKGFILSESLKNPLILNDLKAGFVRVEKRSESKEFPFWYLFVVEFKDEDVKNSIKLISGNLKYGWYAHFWDESVVYICFLDKIFKVPREQGRGWKSDEFKAAIEYGAKNGVDPIYFSDFWIED
ncbi:MAG: hypothetical protein WA093_00190 [Minisyncoccales bacterium]|jgi:hypothetical protein